MGNTEQKSYSSKADSLINELKTLKDLIATEKDAGVREELKTERIKIVAELNRALGTKIETINN